MAASSTAHQGPAPPRSPGSNRRGGPGRGHLGPSASPPARPFPTRAGGRTCSSTVLGVTFTVWRRPFGASTDTAEPPPPAGAAIFRSRDRGRLASNYFICNSRDARPRGFGGGVDWGPRPRLRPWRPGHVPGSAAVRSRRGHWSLWSRLKGSLVWDAHTAARGAVSLSLAHGPKIRHVLETACKKATLPAANPGSCSRLSATES